ncbi:unnamed protein product [Bemisia tabaci]|uniref:Uncharacterized protein n=1 Tax=Bemisia tabaci TaxID=7038 RepID=A0A9P0F988_BEMTA|nr:unnamed protein product [Bemisia tabaci]
MVVLEPVTQEAVSAAAAAAAAAAVGLLDHPHPHHAHAQHPAVAPVPQETSAASAVSPVVSARSSMKILPKRFINLHQWLTPICPKQLKESLVKSGMVLGTYIAYMVPRAGPLKHLNDDKLRKRVANSRMAVANSGPRSPTTEGTGTLIRHRISETEAFGRPAWHTLLTVQLSFNLFRIDSCSNFQRIFARLDNANVWPSFHPLRSRPESWRKSCPLVKSGGMKWFIHNPR